MVGNILDKAESNFHYGYNAATGKYVDMVASGIVDPLKVVRTALTDASAIASLLTTSEAMIVDAPQKETAGAAGANPMMGGMGGMGGMM